MASAHPKRRVDSAHSRSQSRPTSIADHLAHKVSVLAAQTPEAEAPELLAERRAVRAAWLRARGVGELFIDIDLEQIPAHFPGGYRRLAKRLQHLLVEPAIIAVVGPRGLGKTALACATMGCFYDRGRRYVWYATARSYLRQLLNATNYERRGKIFDSFARADLVVLDEMQERGDSAWHQGEIIDLIDVRYMNRRPCILLSNLEPAAFLEDVGGSLHRRIVETGGVVKCDWTRIHELLKQA